MAIIRTQFQKELVGIEESLVRMEGLARNLLIRAVQAYNDGNIAIVEEVLDLDDEVDTMEMDIERECLRLLALQQPIARDLRRVSSAIKVSYELERVGDQAVEIAKNTRKLVQQCFCSRPLIDVGPMTRAATRLLDESLAAFLRHDVDLVNRVCKDDDYVDDEYKKLRAELLNVAQRDHLLVPATAYTLMIITSIERAADHATNIAERVAFIETGELRRLAREHRLDAMNVQS